jgi:transcriptional regulator with XRE-family HTH domain
MAKGTPPSGRPGRVVIFLRAYAEMTQAELARAVGISQKDISQYESGRKSPAEDTLRRLAEAAGFPWGWTVHLRRFLEVLDLALERGTPLAEESLLGTEIGSGLWLALAPYLLEDLTPEPTQEEQRAEAEEIWLRLRQYPMEKIRRYLGGAPEENLTPALAAVLRTASRERAAEKPEEARELSELAAWVSDEPDETSCSKKDAGSPR